MHRRRLRADPQTDPSDSPVQPANHGRGVLSEDTRALPPAPWRRRRYHSPNVMRLAIQRSRAVIALTAAALMLCLVLGVVFVTLHHLDQRGVAADPASRPLSDDQARQQVLDAARQFVATGELADAAGTYALTSCSAEDEPPYQGAIYLNFDIPRVAETQALFRSIAGAMTARGWTEGRQPNRHPDGRVLTKDGVTAVYHRDPDRPGKAVLQIHGECRNVTDHRADTTGFTDISGELSG